MARRRSARPFGITVTVVESFTIIEPREFLMPTVPNPDLAPLVGSWRLLSAGMTYADTKERIEPWGPTPVGCMVLDPGGRIMFLFTKPNRLAPTNDSERAALFDGLLSYSGLMRLDGPGRFITTVD